MLGVFALASAAIMSELGVSAYYNLIPLFFIFVAIIGAYLNSTDYSKPYKQIVFSALAEVSDLDWEYHKPDKKTRLTAKKAVSDSKLFQHAGRVSRGDTLTATMDGNQLGVYEVTVAPKWTVHQEKEILFSGLLATVKVDTSFSAETFVITTADDVPVAKEAVESFQPVELEWGEFERFLSVFSTDQSAVREIFTPDFMAILYDWWKHHDKRLRLAFVGSYIYIAIPAVENFEPEQFVSAPHQDSAIKDMFDFVKFIEDTVELVTKENGKRL